MPLVSLDQTITLALSVSDRHASARWYEDMLGFEVLYHADAAGWSELQTKTPGVVMGLGEHTKPAPGNCVPVFGIADLDGARATLEQAGVAFDGATDVVEGMVKTATFFDPDGNALMLAEDLTGGAA
ncbi:putative enzyme related to lactoylglutathione lyase [Tritonibacter multivorans]|uniref:Putative enzyme related to lactoylglutathione lyase n=1 Tax=Tritonibacter multivorans TaxID=928856 RepID=A0A0P1G3M1_9RHOB|nr:VOC family protein [Tritonibacter multivorans]MDA7422602.1 VOC family protein [Tritonibacter multivorans]CUH76456.1 putative enzyme related to lactoylglutathione lyase [Tritonibacter multivorans]SFD37681.1 Glyoxalase-like domain-containing protein [Tritonibacter multivorans]